MEVAVQDAAPVPVAVEDAQVVEVVHLHVLEHVMLLAQLLVQRRVRQHVTTLVLLSVLVKQEPYNINNSVYINNTICIYAVDYSIYPRYNKFIKQGGFTMKTYTIPVTQEAINLVQQLYFDIKMRKEVITSMVNTGDANILSNPAFKAYSAELTELGMKYDCAMAELGTYFMPKDFIGKHDYTWDVQFWSREIILTVKCDCGVKAYDEYQSKNSRTV